MSVRRYATLVFVFALLPLPTSQAFANGTESNLAHYPGPSPRQQKGFGVFAGLTIPLSGDTTSSRERGPQFQLSAGPAISVTSSRLRQTTFSPLWQMSFTPRRSTEVKIAGFRLMKSWDSTVSASERADDDRRSGMTSAGLTAILLGSAALVGGAILIADSGSCGSISDPCKGQNLPGV